MRARLRVPPRPSSPSVTVLDRLLAVAATVALVAYTWAANGVEPASVTGTGLAVAVGVGTWFRRRTPLVAGVAVAVAAAVYELAVRQAGAVLLAPLLLGFYGIGAFSPLPRAAVGLMLAYVATVLGFLGEDASLRDWLGNLAFVAMVAVGVWASGVVVRASRGRAAQLADLAAELEREREEKARLAVAAERARIARELHDVVAHAISVIAVQAGAGRHAHHGEPARTHEAFHAIESTARQALVEMRRLLGLLREEGELTTTAPMPGVDGHAELIEQARAAGLWVEVAVDGRERALPAGLDLAAYRILQEALTNVRKHAPGAHVNVRIGYGPDDVEIEVRDDGSGSPAGGSDGGDGGHGLIGMRERVALYRGELEAGPLPEGGFRVRARLPLAEDRA